MKNLYAAHGSKMQVMGWIDQLTQFPMSKERVTNSNNVQFFIFDPQKNRLYAIDTIF